MQKDKRGISKFIAIIIVVVIVIALAFFIFGNNGTGNATSNTIQNTQNTETGKTKLSDSQYASYAYLISTETLSSDAQTATTGFNIKKTENSDGSTTYDLIAVNPEYQTQEYTIQPNQQLYFIERSLGDDQNGEGFLGDDMAIVVDSNGYIVSGPGPA